MNLEYFQQLFGSGANGLAGLGGAAMDGIGAIGDGLLGGLESMNTAPVLGDFFAALGDPTALAHQQAQAPQPPVGQVREGYTPVQQATQPEAQTGGGIGKLSTLLSAVGAVQPQAQQRQPQTLPSAGLGGRQGGTLPTGLFDPNYVQTMMGRR